MKGYFRKRDNGKWSFTIDIGKDPATGRRKQKSRSGFKTKKEAQASCAQLIHELEQGTFQREDNIKFADFFERFIKSEIEPNFEPATIEGYQKTLRIIIRPYWGHVMIHQITPMMISDLYQQLTERYSPRTLSLYHGHIKRVLGTAYLWGIIKSDPCVVRPPKSKHSDSSQNYWTVDECMKFLDGMKGHQYEMVFKLAIWGGLRRGEILGLSRKNVDFDNNALLIRQQLVTLNGRVDLKKKLKSESSRRDVTLPPDLMAELKQHITEQRQKHLAIGIQNDDDLVFLTSKGKWVHPNQMNKLFRTKIQELGLKHIPFHGLRHSSATMLSEMKESVHAISQRLGHASTTITNEMYVHLTEKMQQNLSNKLTDFYNENRM